ncbi:MAG: hypothetical protein HQK65_21830 [Desulfamplus sp.]|nr:hypothetical protein [Desulfamplus sp.]
MKFTVLGSGGCMVIPKPLCYCRVCEEARVKKSPYERTGPSAFLHDISMLIDTPAEICRQLNRSRIDRIKYLIFTHLDPDHTEGFRIVEQASLDFRSWKAYPDKQITLVLPETLMDRIRNIHSAYGSMIDFYIQQGFIRIHSFDQIIQLGSILIEALSVPRDDHFAYIYIFKQNNKKLIYAPCDIKPFPIDHPEVMDADLLVIQPGIFETGLKHDFLYPSNHISRTTLYTFEDTLKLANDIRSRQILFVHLEEYWNRGYDEYVALEKQFDNISFASDNMHLII